MYCDCRYRHMYLIGLLFFNGQIVQLSIKQVHVDKVLPVKYGFTVICLAHRWVGSILKKNWISLSFLYCSFLNISTFGTYITIIESNRSALQLLLLKLQHCRKLSWPVKNVQQGIKTALTERIRLSLSLNHCMKRYHWHMPYLKVYPEKDLMYLTQLLFYGDYNW